jgi:hypothetical protein
MSGRHPLLAAHAGEQLLAMPVRAITSPPDLVDPIP